MSIKIEEQAIPSASKNLAGIKLVEEGKIDAENIQAGLEHKLFYPSVLKQTPQKIRLQKRMGQQGKYTHLPVLDVTRECVGLITSNSILKNPNAVKVEDAMEGRPTIIDEDLVITEGIEALLSNTQSCILVSHRNSSKIMGIIVAWDLIPNKESMKHSWKRKGQKRV